MILDHGKFFRPGGLIADGGRIVALGLSFHRHPGEMRNADRNAESCLPVALELVAAEIVIPAGNAVKLTEHALGSVLVYDGGRLFGRRVLVEIAEHIDTGKDEGAVAAHGVPHSLSLIAEGALAHDMASEIEVVLSAPVSDFPAVGLYEKIRHQILKAPADGGKLPSGSSQKSSGRCSRRFS